jgi:hypothetical protein
MYDALSKQCTETKECSLIYCVLCMCTYIQRNKRGVYALQLQ